MTHGYGLWDGGVPRRLGQHPSPDRIESKSTFISYRRSDEAGFAGRLYDRLVAKFGEDHVFMDVDSIELGVAFKEVLQRAVDQCTAFVAIIGTKWLNATDEFGKLRLEDPDDYVRMEIESALSRPNIPIIPILVDGALMPKRADLPESLARLAERNAWEMSHAQFGSDCLKLVRTLEHTLGSDDGQRSRRQGVLDERIQTVAPELYDHAVCDALRRVWPDDDAIVIEPNYQRAGDSFDIMVKTVSGTTKPMKVAVMPALPGETFISLSKIKRALGCLSGYNIPGLFISNVGMAPEAQSKLARSRSMRIGKDFALWRGSVDDAILKQQLEWVLDDWYDAGPGEQ